MCSIYLFGSYVKSVAVVLDFNQDLQTASVNVSCHRTWNSIYLYFADVRSLHITVKVHFSGTAYKILRFCDAMILQTIDKYLSVTDTNCTNRLSATKYHKKHNV